MNSFIVFRYTIACDQSGSLTEDKKALAEIDANNEIEAVESFRSKNDVEEGVAQFKDGGWIFTMLTAELFLI